MYAIHSRCAKRNQLLMLLLLLHKHTHAHPQDKCTVAPTHTHTNDPSFGGPRQGTVMKDSAVPGDGSPR
uniref:Putative secreted protein n=1 Tax=Anopheles triannulatus TaxID=58253 RepID=A0A2M4B2J6_9DIPT